MIERKIERKIGPSLNEMGYEIYRIKVYKNSNKNTFLQIMIENKNGNPITLTDCSKVSKRISVLLDVEELIKNSYNLEISSPGINKPLNRLSDFLNYVGKNISIKLKDKTIEKKVFFAKILSVENNLIKILKINNNVEMDVSISQISDSYLIDEIQN